MKNSGREMMKRYIKDDPMYAELSEKFDNIEDKIDKLLIELEHHRYCFDLVKENTDEQKKRKK